MKINAKNSGFILVSTIWILAALVVFVSFIAVATARVQDNVAKSLLEIQTLMEFRKIESTVTYLLATQPMSYAGLTTTPVVKAADDDRTNPFAGDLYTVKGGEIRLDGRPYSGSGDVNFSLNDTSGLVSLRVANSQPVNRLRTLLAFFGIGEQQSALLVERLRDYIDRDDIERLDGMEASAYLQRQMTPPTNRFLASPTQLLNVPGWEAALGDQFDDFMRVVTVGIGNRPNYNSMHPDVMRASGLEESAVLRLVEHRQTEAFETLAEVNEIAGTLIPVDELDFSSVPDTLIRLTMWHEASGQEQWIGIRLTPRLGAVPWKIDYRATFARIDPSSSLTKKRPDHVAAVSTAPQSSLFR